MAGSVGVLIFFVVVVCGLGSLAGAFAASLLIGLVQTFAVVLDVSLLTLLTHFGYHASPDSPAYPLLMLSVAQLAPVLPFLLMVLMLVVRPRGLLGTREG